MKDSKRTIADAARLNMCNQSELSQRAKVAYDAYTVAAGALNPAPFISLWPREREAWVAVVEALEPEE